MNLKCVLKHSISKKSYQEWTHTRPDQYQNKKINRQYLSTKFIGCNLSDTCHTNTNIGSQKNIVGASKHNTVIEFGASGVTIKISNPRQA